MIRKALTKADKAYVRIETRLTIIGAVMRLFEKLEKQGKITEKDIDDRLGVSHSGVNKFIAATGNCSLDTVADLLAAMDAKLTKVEVKLREKLPYPEFGMPVDDD
jgi:hypothetical protein